MHDNVLQFQGYLSLIETQALKFIKIEQKILSLNSSNRKKSNEGRQFYFQKFKLLYLFLVALLKMSLEKVKSVLLMTQQVKMLKELGLIRIAMNSYMEFVTPKLENSLLVAVAAERPIQKAKVL